MIGKISDQISVKIMMPIALIVRGIFLYAAYLMKNPFESWAFYFVVPMIHVTYYGCTIILIGYIEKMYPREIRGMLNSI
jgi:hypothetical protein